jgi:carbon-monoxide dehydrogenase iron sulfur subunit
MKQKVLVVYPHKCTGCRICEQWCAQTHHGEMNPAKARLAVHRIHDRQINVPVACSQCVKAPCIELCPSQCIGRNDETFGLVLDANECIGCRMCVDGCVRGCVKMDADEEVPLLCDLCDGDPQCVRHCPEGAIEYVPLDQTDRGFRQRHAERLVEGKGGVR